MVFGQAIWVYRKIDDQLRSVEFRMIAEKLVKRENNFGEGPQSGKSPSSVSEYVYMQRLMAFVRQHDSLDDDDVEYGMLSEDSALLGGESTARKSPLNQLLVS